MNQKKHGPFFQNLLICYKHVLKFDIQVYGTLFTCKLSSLLCSKFMLMTRMRVFDLLGTEWLFFLAITFCIKSFFIKSCSSKFWVKKFEIIEHPQFSLCVILRNFCYSNDHFKILWMKNKARTWHPSAIRI